VDTQAKSLRYSLVAVLVAALAVPAAAHVRHPAARVAGPRETAVRTDGGGLRAGARAPRPGAALAALEIESQQPSVIYADARAFSFNTGFGTSVRPDLLASFDRPLDQSQRPVKDDGTWAIAFAKTVTFFFAPDSANTRVPGAFALWREVNDAAPQILVRNVLADSLPFFVYKCAAKDPSGDSLALVPAERLPITFADTSEAGIDAQSIRAVELHFLVTNGERGAAQKVERVSVVAMLPAVGQGAQPVSGDHLAPVDGLARHMIDSGKVRGDKKA
jgi:hypothetical protein